MIKDDTGKQGYYKDKRELESRGLYVRRLEHPGSLKDPGDMVDLLYKGDLIDYTMFDSIYRQSIARLIEVL